LTIARSLAPPARTTAGVYIKVQILPLLSVEAGQDACQARRLAFVLCGYVLTFTLGYCEKEYIINHNMHFFVLSLLDSLISKALIKETVFMSI
jgi:hypothetical protein